MASKLYEIAFQIAGKVNSSFKSSTASASEKLREINTEARKLNKMDEAYNKGTAAAKKFSMSQAEVKKRLSEIIPLQNKFNKQAELNRKIQANDGAISNKRGQLFDAAAMTAVVASPVMAFAKAEESATQLKSTMMDASGAVSGNFQAINKLATDLGNKLPGATSDFHELFNVMLQNGIKSEQILGGIGKAAAYIGVQLKIPYVEAGRLAAQMQKSTGVADKDMMEFMDTVQRLSMFGIKIDEMDQAFSKLGATTSMLKLQGIENMKVFGPMLGMIMQYGLKGEAAGNAMGKVLRAGLNLDKVKKANKELSVLGIKLNFIDKKGGFAGVDNMMRQLEKLKGISQVRRAGVIKELFGDDAETLQTVSYLIEKGQAGLKEMTAKMNAQASLQQRVDIQLGTLSSAWESFTGTLQNVAVLLGAPLAQAINPALNTLNSFVGDKLMPFVQNNQKLVAGIMGTVAGFISLKIISTAVGYGFLLLKGGVLAAVKIFGSMINVIMNVFKVFRMISIFLIANPWIAAIMAVAVAAFLIYKNWDTIKAWLLKAWEVISAKFTEAWLVIKEIGIGVWEALKGAFMAYVNFWKTGITWIVEWFQSLSLYDSGVKMIETLVNGIKAMASYPVEVIKGIFSKVGEYLPHSDADKGPLSTLTASGAAIVDTMAQGARRAASNNNIGAAAVGGFSSVGKISTMADTAGTGVGGMTISYSPTIYVSGPDAAQNKAAVESGLKSGLDDFSKRMKDFLSQEKRLSYA